MIQYITTLSKYFIAVIIALYSLECFLALSNTTIQKKKNIYRFQVILIILFQFAGILSFTLQSGEISKLIFCLLFQTLILLVLELLPMFLKKLDRLFLNNSCLLISIGLISLLRLNFKTATKQLIIVTASFVLGAVIYYLVLKIKRLPNLTFSYAAIGIFLLAFSLILGSFLDTSKLSITFFGISIMPSEFVKILFVFFIASSINKDRSFKNLIITAILSAIQILLLAFSDDLCGALILYAVFVLMVFISYNSYIYLAIGTAGGVVISIASYFLFPGIKSRILAFINPFSVIDNEGYQLSQSLFAISSGSWFGVGLFNGTPDAIPYVETDLIFAVITQEFGIIFSVCFILICISTVLIFIKQALNTKNILYKLIITGLSFIYALQIFISVGGSTKLVPLVGVTLPLISHGGSSIMATLIAFFIIEALYALDEIPDDSVVSKQRVMFERKNNKNLFRLTYLFMGLFTILVINFLVISTKDRIELLNNPYNPMKEVVAKKIIRGPIYSRDMEILAKTETPRGKEEIRSYPFYNMFSHVIGYSANGSSGMESYGNFYLINSNENIWDRISADMNGRKYIGDGIVTTLDCNLQRVAYDAIGNFSGCIIISNPKTGEILSLVSKPDFDPNDIKDEWEEYLSDTNAILLNRATQGQYSIGNLYIKEGLLKGNSENLFSPMAVHEITSSIACGGESVKPYVLAKVLNKNMNTVKILASKRDTVSLEAKKTSAVLDNMKNNAKSTRGKRFTIDKNSVAFLTEVGDGDTSDSPHAWFTGFAPVEDPQICVTIVLENAGNGALYAVPVADTIFNYYFSK